MRIFQGTRDLPQGLKASVVTIGNFDGVHLGHQKLIQRVKEKAKGGGPSVVMTFEPHPAVILAPERPFSRLFSLEDQAEQLEHWGLDILIREPFTLQLASLSPQEFFQKILRALHPRALVIGYDFRFGKDRQGDFELLKSLAGPQGLEVERVEPYQLHGEVVSSSRIRQLLSKGDLQGAQELLGRNYSVDGVVTHGESRGHRLGFPTANLIQPLHWSLRKGVYITKIQTCEGAYPAITNVGVNPTFDDGPQHLKVESFIFDLNRDLYDEKIKVEFYRFVRPEQKFKDAQELVEQVQKDIVVAKDYWREYWHAGP